MGAEHIPVSVGGRVLRISNLDKVLYPGSGFTKREVLDYYVAVAEALLPRLAGRPVTLLRFPDGAKEEGFFEKHAARHAPEWVRTADIPTKEGTKEYVFLEELPALVWAANLAALELHVTQWRLTDSAGPRVADLLVFDLDPGEPATIVECCRVAELLRAELAEHGLPAFPKTSGSKGMQLYVPVRVREERDTARFAKWLASRLATKHRELVTASMTRSIRPGRVFIDWSQNNPAKTTIAAYSLRGNRAEPSVSTPVSWDEVRACADPATLRFDPAEVRARLAEHGDLLAGMDAARTELSMEGVPE